MFSRLFAISPATTNPPDFRPAFECLEGRITPSTLNYITTAKSGSTLTITANNAGGVDNNNKFNISSGGGQGTIAVGAGYIHGQSSFTGISNLKVVLKDGMDSIILVGVNLSGNLTVSGGPTGDKQIVILSTKIAGTTTITTAGGNDALENSADQFGSMILSLGAGSDTFFDVGSTFAGAVRVDMGAGNDTAILGFFSNNVGQTTVTFPGVSVLIPAVQISMGAGDDAFYDGYESGPGGGVNATGLVLVDGGTGSDTSYAFTGQSPNLFLFGFESTGK